jgi:pseudouridine-5'-phosphate glycosidase
VNKITDPFKLSQNVKSALNRGEPVVALESSLIAQGLPEKINAETARSMEKIVRQSGAVPATIGLIDGKPTVGLSDEDIGAIAESRPPKVGVRDLPYFAVRRLSGGTTVASTARIATAAGIAVMATGGIGGVHRGEANDVSADLWELAQNPIVVVCSGVKSILDVPKTVEWLETHGVPIYGWQTDELPAFESPKSGIAVPKINDASELLEICRVTRACMGQRSAIVVAVPIPAEDAVDVSWCIEQALAEAESIGVSGKELTPFLLRRVGELSCGEFIDANIALLKNNAQVAAEIAVAISGDRSTRIGFLV